MIKAVLLDLDDTLLRCSDQVFVPEYLRKVDAYFAARWNHAQMSHLLRQFIRAAAGPRDVRWTNTDLAESIIVSQTGHPAEGIRTAFAEFYATAYPQLADCVEQVPVAPALVHRLREQGFALVIATNPLYPQDAIRQRLVWAGLSADPADYALITHSDNMHFTKPDPAYYAEIIARVGVEPDEALMVGDSVTNDMQSAAALGLSTYLVTEEPPDYQPDGWDHAGTLAEFFHLTGQDSWTEHFSPRLPRPAAIEPQFRGNLGALFGMLANVQPNHWHQHPDPNEWSIMEIVCHLLASETAVQRPRLERILAEDNPFISAPKPPPGPGAIPPCDSDGWRVAERFMEQREITMRWLLANVEPNDWQRPARHSIFGPTTLLEMAHFTAQHDRLHLNQLCQTLGRCED